ncbi:UNVERIFIED_CONTAM: hypothetical protein GTU68_022481 [Idotea baltica]|nr:hypothetical protein [Idotea baltica]
MCFYMAVVVYAPALALAQVTGLNVHISGSLICFVCIFYTTLGGMKAVLWTDALQTIVMYGSTLFIVIKGAIDEGGFSHVWEVSTRGNRTELFNWDPDPRVRHTFWSLVFGGYFVWIAIYGVNQAQVQRYLCVKTKTMAIRALWINCIGFVVLILTCAFGGLVIYTKYADCDPVSSKLVSKADQILPFFVMDALGEFKGLPGLFVAGIFSGALSTISSGMNSLAAITLEDIIRSVNPNISERTATITSKALSLFYGLLTFFLVFVAERMGDIVSAALGIYGLIGGPLLGVFTLGMFFPHANSFGAIVGTLVGLSLTLWIGIGFQIATHSGQIVFDKLPVNTCNFTQNPFLEQTSWANESFTDFPIAEALVENE